MADDDIRKYLPDTADILRRADEEAAKKRLARALDNPGLDAALADMRTGMKEGEDPLYYDVKQDKGDGAKAPAAAEPVPGAAPAPVTAPVTVPAAGTAVARPRVQLRPPRHAYARRRLSTAATIALAVMAVATPALLVAVLKQPVTTNREPGAVATTVRVAATQESVPVAESASMPAESKAAVDGGVSAVHDAGTPAKLPVQSSPAPTPVLKPRPASPSSQPPPEPPEAPKPSPTTSEGQPEF